ncbi:MAG: hypothetical protein LUE14_04560 [Clostridiales bacterium]|nr:hypothetical protein [Clostridiales bacterium]
MGIFTWTDCQDRRKKIQYGGRAYVSCPDGSVIFEPSYYGYFGGHDIYELAVDFNRGGLDEIFKRMRKEREFPATTARWNRWQSRRWKATRSEKKCHCGISCSVNWKRELGMLIACEDRDNRSLPFPIKVSRTEPEKPYRMLKPSFCTQ